MTPLRFVRLLLRATVVAALPPWSTLASVQEPTTVTIGGVARKAIGTITGMTAGDVACYVSLRDDRGAAFEEMADFGICEREAELKGRRVRLTYELGKVLADSCKGNPDCKQTRTVALIRTATVIGSVSKPAGAR